MRIFIIGILILTTLFDLILTYLNYKNRHQPIPENVKDVYDETTYKTWLQYTMENFKVNLYSKVLNAVFLIVLLATPAFPRLADFTHSITESKVFEPILFLVICGAVSYLTNIGFDIYKTFKIEQKYGFNTTTPKTFMTDQIKQILLMGSLAFGILSFIFNVYHGIGIMAFVYIWLFLVVILLTINILYIKVFIRFFNKLTPLPEGELYDKTQALAQGLGYEIKTISIMNASKRSTKLNAFFTGFGRFKNVVLYDTLVEKCTTDEIISVLAHEIGHAKHKDTLRSIVETCLEMVLYLSLLAGIFTLSNLYSSFGFSGIHLGFAFILFYVLVKPVHKIINIPILALSRKAEFKADGCAANAGYKTAMISALKTLSKENYSNLTPHPFYVKMTYTHPTTSQRIDALDVS